MGQRGLMQDTEPHGTGLGEGLTDVHSGAGVRSSPLTLLPLLVLAEALFLLPPPPLPPSACPSSSFLFLLLPSLLPLPPLLFLLPLLFLQGLRLFIK